MEFSSRDIALLAASIVTAGVAIGISKTGDDVTPLSDENIAIFTIGITRRLERYLNGKE